MVAPLAPRGGGIYIITNILNGKRYVGSAACFRERRAEHFRSLRKQSHKNKHLQAAFNKYGEDAFTFEVLEFVEDKTQLLIREQHFLDTLKPEYNKALIAGNTLGLKRTPEQRERQRQIGLELWKNRPNPFLGKTHSEETKKILSQKTKSRMTKEHRKWLSELARMRPAMSEEVRNKISNAGKGRPTSDKQKEATRKSNTNRVISARTLAALNRTGIKLSDVHRRKIGNVQRGKHKTQKHRNNLSVAKKNSLKTQEHLVRLNAANSTLESRERSRELATGRKHTPEEIEKMRKRSPQARANVIAANKARFAAKRDQRVRQQTLWDEEASQ